MPSSPLQRYTCQISIGSTKSKSSRVREPSVTVMDANDSKMNESKKDTQESQIGVNDKRKWPMTAREEAEYLTKFEGVIHKEKQAYLNFFKKADISETGELTVQQFRDAVVKQLRFTGSSYQVARIFTDLNPNIIENDVLLTVDEFMTQMCKKDGRKRTKEDLEEIFQTMDINKDGVITPDEIMTSLQGVNKLVSESTVKDTVRKHDLDRDGALSLHEFLQACERK